MRLKLYLHRRMSCLDHCGATDGGASLPIAERDYPVARQEAATMLHHLHRRQERCLVWGCQRWCRHRRSPCAAPTRRWQAMLRRARPRLSLRPRPSSRPHPTRRPPPQGSPPRAPPLPATRGAAPAAAPTAARWAWDSPPRSPAPQGRRRHRRHPGRSGRGRSRAAAAARGRSPRLSAAAAPPLAPPRRRHCARARRHQHPRRQRRRRRRGPRRSAGVCAWRPSRAPPTPAPAPSAPRHTASTASPPR